MAAVELGCLLDFERATVARPRAVLENVDVSVVPDLVGNLFNRLAGFRFHASFSAITVISDRHAGERIFKRVNIASSRRYNIAKRGNVAELNQRANLLRVRVIRLQLRADALFIAIEMAIDTGVTCVRFHDNRATCAHVRCLQSWGVG